MHKIGKLNSSIDIIPLQGSSGDYRSKHMDNKHRMDQRLFRDQLLIGRVQMYMHDNENKVYIDVNDMADALQRRYRDYRGKKRGPFRRMVREAYDELTKIFSNKPSTRECSVYDDDDFEDVDVESDSQRASISDMLLRMYKKPQYKQNGNSSDKELIDISSDDDVSKDDSKTEKDIKTPEPGHLNMAAEESSGLMVTVNPEIIGPETVESETTTSKQETAKSEISAVTLEASVKSNLLMNQVVKQSLESTRKRQRDKESGNGQFSIKKARIVPIMKSKISFSDVGGSDKVLKTVCKLLAHIKHPEIFKQLGISPPRGFLLHGPPGCGKTLLAHAVAGELNIPLIKVAGPELVTGVSGESEARIRELFEQALILAPCVVFLDEIDAVTPHRATAQREMERRIVAQLLSSLDELNLNQNGDRVLVIGATNRPDSLDPALRRAGRFDREVCLGIPDREARARILAVHTEKVVLAPNVSLSTIASLTPGFVGADLVALIREAAMVAVDRVFEDLNKSKQEEKSSEVTEIEKQPNKETEIPENSENLIDTSVTTRSPTTTIPTTIENDLTFPQELPKNSIPEIAKMDIIQEHSADLSTLLTWLHTEPPLSPKRLSTLCIEHSDFETALRIVQPSAKREGFATVPDVTWDDVGSLRNIRQELQMAILAPVKHSEHFNTLGLTAASGVLLCGPPGCGKTLLAKAVANEAGINFISVKGPELLNMYVGESEKAVRQCFLRARNSSPCVIFFDEIDALCPKRTEGDNSASARVVNQMLTEMDGVEGRQGVFLMAASNRPDIIDPAVLRPGRLDKIVYVGLPNASDRVDILRAVTKNATRPKLASDVDLNQVAYDNRCDGYTGADLAALIREAGMEALKEIIAGYGQPEISMRHIFQAFDKVQPSVREKDIKHYEKLSKLYLARKNPEITPMDTPVEVTPLDAPIVDVVMEPMET
ncbi:PREDICTED: nuclear valosin-containing protein-like [Cyphomyrmex costatus]|uniref:nuclear valosin-containing protein-like n=2 Tax=Cyphomyrmex costatus TaxID=456900 RepID=UPI0008522D3E|nr:PREDICTED: nuclear valosin-containing protein-like [Cyphomyrmex costatus]XP_018404186.1 PREDICTED: nuclear valosin-containing protein-like [Cyphomyrmex costatus]